MSTNYFRPSEFACKCGRVDCDAPTLPPASLLDPLNVLRERVGRPLLITSGFRCKAWNEKAGGALDSEHLTGEAADILCGTDRERWGLLHANFAGAMPIFRHVRIGETFVHFGVSPQKNDLVGHYYPKKKATVSA